MQPAIPFRFKKKQFWLSAECCLFWEDQQSLILSDLHFGKTGHFRKAGIAVPQAVYKEDLQRLFQQIQYFQPRKLIVVGDLFHSQANKELELFRKWRADLPGIGLHLVKGNHDILQSDWYSSCQIEVNEETLLLDELGFIHDIGKLAGLAHKDFSDPTYFFSGHIHPGVRVNGLGKQSICLPCFYFGEEYAVLPAFSRFTGIAMIQPSRDEHVFAIAESKIIRLQ
jgi:uncharacterized protein